MKPFDYYSEYMAIKAHFNNPSYDYKKYHGKTNVKESSFSRRRDRSFYEKAYRKFRGRESEYQKYLISNFTINRKFWIGELFTDESEKNYNDMIRRWESRPYIFDMDIDRLSLAAAWPERFDLDVQIKKLEDYFLPYKGSHPVLFKLCRMNEISVDTLVIFDEILSIFKFWSEKLEDPISQDSLFSWSKYKTFVDIDDLMLYKGKIKKICNV